MSDRSSRRQEANRCLRSVDAADTSQPDPSGDPCSDAGAPFKHRLVQSSRAAYSIRWSETGLLGNVPADAAGDWPSDRWRAHLVSCPDGRKCRCRVPEPVWWVLMAGRGMPLHPDAEVARQMAHEVITRFKGQPALPEAERTFVQDTVRDALFIAPQPVSKEWVRSSLSIVTRLVRTISEEGAPLTREHVFSQRARNRFVHQHLATSRSVDVTVRYYESRINLVAAALQGVTYRDKSNQPARFADVPPEPVTLQQEAALWLWATGLRSEVRRRRLSTMVAFGLGVGIRTHELLQTQRQAVDITDTGVHVNITNVHTGVERVVTCRRVWEDAVRDLCGGLGPDALLMEPSRTTPLTYGSQHSLVHRTQQQTEPPVWINHRRLRLTWMVRMLDTGVPLPTLMSAADVDTSDALTRLLPYVSAQSPGDAATSLRG